MFDIGFWELAIIGVVALLVIGPERLPSVAKTVGQWMGKTKQFVNHVQSDIKQELGKADELKKLLAEQAQIKEVHEIIEQTVSEAKKIVSVGADLSNHAIKSFDQVETATPVSRSIGSSDTVIPAKPDESTFAHSHADSSNSGNSNPDSSNSESANVDNAHLDGSDVKKAESKNSE